MVFGLSSLVCHVAMLSGFRPRGRSGVGSAAENDYLNFFKAGSGNGLNSCQVK
jgi:hypothetical protein